MGSLGEKVRIKLETDRHRLKLLQTGMERSSSEEKAIIDPDSTGNTAQGVPNILIK